MVIAKQRERVWERGGSKSDRTEGCRIYLYSFFEEFFKVLFEMRFLEVFHVFVELSGSRGGILSTHFLKSLGLFSKTWDPRF